MSADELEEIDIGDGDKPRPTFISRKLSNEVRKDLINLLKEYRDCFAWDYSEMLGLIALLLNIVYPLSLDIDRIGSLLVMWTQRFMMLL